MGKCPHFARNRMKLHKKVTRFQLFLTKEPLSPVWIDILGPFIRTSPNNNHLLVITDRFSKKTNTITMKGISDAEVAKHFLNSCLFNYMPPEELIANKGECFTSKFSQDVFRIMFIQNNFTATCPPQRNGQVERTIQQHYPLRAAYVRSWSSAWPGPPYGLLNVRV